MVWLAFWPDAAALILAGAGGLRHPGAGRHDSF